MEIKAARIYIPSEDIETFQKESQSILSSGQLILGEKTHEFEEAVQSYLGINHTIAVNSGTSALEIALRAFNVKGKEVIIPTNTFIATVNAARYAGAEVVLSDINLETLAPSLEQIKKQVTPKTKAVVIVHIGGVITPEIEEIATYCKQNELILIEDAAHAHGSTFQGKQAGTFGDAGCFSYFPTKVITTNEGGMITTNNSEIAKLARGMRDHGKIDRYANYHELEGNSWRITELNALLGILQMKRLPDFLKLRQQIAEWYNQSLGDIEGIEILKIPDEVQSNYYKYIVSIFEKSGLDRNLLKKVLKEKYNVGLSGEVYTHGCHEQPILQISGFRGGPFQNAEKFCKNHLCLPIYNDMNTEEALYVIQSFRSAINSIL